MSAKSDSGRDSEYTVLSSTPLFSGRFISVRTDQVRMSDGSVSAREIVDHPGAVGIVALDEKDQVVLVNQYRHPVGRRLDELPAGLLDVDGEPALDAAKRELFEEAALYASQWHVLVDLYTSPGFTNEAIRLYLARGLTEVAAGDEFSPEHEEITLTVARVPLAEAVRRALAGELTNGPAIAGILAAATARPSDLRPASAPWRARPDRAGPGR